jgi:hypothetical protein
MNDVEKVDRLIQKGNEVLATHHPNPPGVIGFPTLDSGAFSAWKSQCLNFLETRLPPNSPYTREFREKIKERYRSTVEAGIGIMESVKEDLGSSALEVGPNPINLLRVLCDRFHLVARQIRSRHDDRPTLDIQDEYDAQDLFHALLLVYFDDIRPEEWTPSYAGSSARMDFLLKQERFVIELKKTRKGLGAKELGSQLIEDIERYKSHPDCDILICLVYDPEGRIANPRGIENDLNRTSDELSVLVMIRP